LPVQVGLRQFAQELARLAVVGIAVASGLRWPRQDQQFLGAGLEYFLNARTTSTQVHVRSWELLIAMLLMEAAFGLPAVITAPIYYAYLKSELVAGRLI